MPELIQGTRHREPRVRHGCFWILDRCEGPGVFGVFPAMIKGLDDPEPKVRDFVRLLLIRRLKSMSIRRLQALSHLTHPGLNMLISDLLTPCPESVSVV